MEYTDGVPLPLSSPPAPPPPLPASHLVGMLGGKGIKNKEFKIKGKSFFSRYQNRIHTICLKLQEDSLKILFNIVEAPFNFFLIL